MICDRRFFLASLSASFLTSAPSSIASRAGEPAPDLLFAACRKNQDGSYAAAIFSPERGDITSVSLPARGHDAVTRPGTDHCVIFARRPGNFAVILSADARQKPFWFTTKPGRHIYGHGVFSPDGKLLYTTENDFENEKGVIGIRDATDSYKQIGEFRTTGIGPHDVGLLSDGQTAVIANGGILTLPETGRTKLNIAEMKPSLVYMDLQTGEVVEKVELSEKLHKLSIRHLAIAKDDVVAFGCQYQGVKTDQPPLLGFHKRGQKPRLEQPKQSVLSSMQNYVGSVTTDRSGELVAASCPRGNIVTYWDAVNYRYLGKKVMRDVCGVAPTNKPGEFLHTSGEGDAKILDYHPDYAMIGSKNWPGVAWDNHAIRLPIRAR